LTLANPSEVMPRRAAKVELGGVMRHHHLLGLPATVEGSSHVRCQDRLWIHTHVVQEPIGSFECGVVPSRHGKARARLRSQHTCQRYQTPSQPRVAEGCRLELRAVFSKRVAMARN